MRYKNTLGGSNFLEVLDRSCKNDEVSIPTIPMLIPIFPSSESLPRHFHQAFLTILFSVHLSHSVMEMDYASLIQPVDELPPYEEYMEPFCNELLEKIAKKQRNLEVALKAQGIQVRKEVRNVWSEYSTEYQKLMVESGRQLEPQTPNEEEPFLGLIGEDTSIPMSTSTNGIVSDGGVYPSFTGSIQLLEEVVDWKISFAQGLKVKDSKLFFFGSILFRMSFGLNSSRDFYYLHIAPAERLETDVRIHCKYHIHDPSTGAVLITQVAEANYMFRRSHQDSAGVDSFIGPEVANYLDKYRRLSLAVVVASEVGRSGQLQGLPLYDGSAVFA